MTLKPIVWRPTLYGFEHGFVGGIHLFSVGYDGTGPKGEGNDAPYILSCQLPGQHRQRRIANMEAGKALAADVLKKWVANLVQPEA